MSPLTWNQARARPSRRPPARPRSSPWASYAPRSPRSRPPTEPATTADTLSGLSACIFPSRSAAQDRHNSFRLRRSPRLLLPDRPAWKGEAGRRDARLLLRSQTRPADRILHDLPRTVILCQRHKYECVGYRVVFLPPACISRFPALTLGFSNHDGYNGGGVLWGEESFSVRKESSVFHNWSR